MRHRVADVKLETTTTRKVRELGEIEPSANVHNLFASSKMRFVFWTRAEEPVTVLARSQVASFLPNESALRVNIDYCPTTRVLELQRGARVHRRVPWLPDTTF